MIYKVTNIMGDNRIFTDNMGGHLLKPNESIITKNPPEEGGAFKVKLVTEEKTNKEDEK